MDTQQIFAGGASGTVMTAILYFLCYHRHFRSRCCRINIDIKDSTPVANGDTNQSDPIREQTSRPTIKENQVLPA
jgi:hypothetical protein